MVDLAKSILHEEPYTKSEVCDVLGVSPDELANTSLSGNTLHGMFDISVLFYSPQIKKEIRGILF